MARTPVNKRQFGTDAVGAPLSFNQLDSNFAYFENMVIGEPGAIPVIVGGITARPVDGFTNLEYAAGRAQASSSLRQFGGNGITQAGIPLLEVSASLQVFSTGFFTGSLTTSGGLFTTQVSASGITASGVLLQRLVAPEITGSLTGSIVGFLSGSMSGSFVGSASGYFQGQVDGTSSFTTAPIQTILTNGNTASADFQLIGTMRLGRVGPSPALGTIIVNGTSSLLGQLTTENTLLGNNLTDVHFVSGAWQIYAPYQSPSVPGGMNVTNDTNLLIGNGTTTIRGTVSLSSSLQVSGATTFNNSVSLSNTHSLDLVSGPLRVGGTTTILRDLAVSASMALVGSASFGNTLSVNGNTILSSSLYVGSNTFITGTLQVTGAVGFASTVDIKNNVTLTGSLSNTGLVALGSTLTVQGAASLSSSLSVVGATTLTGGTTAELTCDASTIEYTSGTTYNSSTSRAIRVKDLGIVTAKIDALAVTTAKIADTNVTTGKIADLNVTTAKIADTNVTTAKIADLNVTTAKIADLNVTTIKIAGSAVTTAKIADANVTNIKLLNDSVTVSAGTNLSGGGAVALGSTITINAANAPTFSGNVTATGFFQSSKRSLKTSIIPFEKDALDIIKKTNVVEFFYLSDLENKHIGFIADDAPIELSTKNQDTMDTNSTLAVALKAIQQLEARVVELEKKLESK